MCYYQRCLMQPDAKDPSVYHCKRHQSSHRCGEVCERWGPDPHLHQYQGYRCPVYQEESTGEVSCVMTGHILDRGQPEYLHSYRDRQHCHQGDPLPPQLAVEDHHYDDKTLLTLFQQQNTDMLVQKFSWLHGHLSPKQQDTLMYLLSLRESIRETFKSDKTHYYYTGIFLVAAEYLALKDRSKLPPLADNKYRRYTEWKAAVKLAWKCLMYTPRVPSNRRRRKPGARPAPTSSKKRPTSDSGSS